MAFIIFVFVLLETSLVAWVKLVMLSLKLTWPIFNCSVQLYVVPSIISRFTRSPLKIRKDEQIWRWMLTGLGNARHIKPATERGPAADSTSLYRTTGSQAEKVPMRIEVAMSPKSAVPTEGERLVPSHWTTWTLEQGILDPRRKRLKDLMRRHGAFIEWMIDNWRYRIWSRRYNEAL